MKKIFFIVLSVIGLNISAFCGNDLKNLPMVKDQVAVSNYSCNLSSDDTFTKTMEDSYGRNVDVTITITIITIGDTIIVVITTTVVYTSLDITYHVNGEYGNGVFNYTITDQNNNVLQLEDCVNTMGEVIDFIESQVINR